MPTCETCDSHVSERFRAVFGDNEGRIHACFECRTRTGLLNGDGVDAGSPASQEGRTATDRNLFPDNGP